MRKVLTLLTFVIAIPLAMSAQETATVNCLGQKKVYVATVPEGTKMVAELKCGEKVVVLVRSGNWAKVRTHKGKEGNLASVFLSVEESSETHAQQPATPSSTAEGVQSSSKAIGSAYADCGVGVGRLPNILLHKSNTAEPITGTLTCGENVDVLAFEGSWVKVRKSTGVEGYVANFFLQSETDHRKVLRAKSSQERKENARRAVQGIADAMMAYGWTASPHWRPGECQSRQNGGTTRTVCAPNDSNLDACIYDWETTNKFTCRTKDGEFVQY
jgi:SH3-like domain-containing protein